MTAVNATSQIYIARQPILDAAGTLHGYELLFRSAAKKNESAVLDATSATAQVMKNSAAFGVEKLVGTHHAFLNCNREILLSDLISLFDPGVFTLEILEDVVIDEPILAVLKKLKEQNFTLALDDFVYNDEEIARAELAMPFIDLIKIDLMLSARETWGAAANFIKSHGKIALAEKVETETDFNECKAFGYDLFQGYFFAKPEMLVSEEELDANVMSVIKFLHLLHSNPEVASVQREFKQIPDLAMSLLKFINSAAFALRNPISSLAQAITLLGVNNLKRWLLMLLYAKKSAGGDMNMSEQSPLLENVTQRAALMEAMAKEVDRSNRAWHEKAFLCGIVSRMDALFHMPMEKIVVKFSLDEELCAGLLRGEGKIGKMITLVSAIEMNQSAEIEAIIAELNITIEQLNACVNKSYQTSITG